MYRQRISTELLNILIFFQNLTFAGIAYVVLNG